jgi:NAD(P)-dependent dehydrogenase (short-subunit alcohol dehydrogenase family)
MYTKQQPLGSGFTAASTADEVLAGIDLTGINVVVTGGHAGIGLETSRALGKAGAFVTAGARSLDRAAKALEGVERVETSRLDLADPASIDAFAARYAGSGRPLHILINNAGVPLHEHLKLDARGYETQFATNCLGHFQLTLGLLRWAEYGIRGYAVHPGIVPGTDLNRSVGEEQQRAAGLIDEDGQPVVAPDRGIKNPRQGASTTVFAATSPLLERIGGVYLKDNDISVLDENPQPLTGAEQDPPADVVPHAIDPRSAQRLWELSEELIKV